MTLEKLKVQHTIRNYINISCMIANLYNDNKKNKVFIYPTVGKLA